MQNLPSIELLEATHQFPCAYTFKVIAYSDIDMLDRVLKAVESTFAPEVKHSTRKSVGGKHIAITLDVSVKAAIEVHEIYRALHSVDGIVLLF